MVISLLVFMFAHFVSDFIFQSREMGKQKSEKFTVLFDHLSIITTGMLAAGILVFRDLQDAAIFAVVNSIVHGVIDWNIWKLYKIYAMGRIKNDAQEIANAYGLSGTGKTKEQVRQEKMDILMQARLEFKYWDDHWFYVTIGFDQFLHAATIVILYGWLA